LTAIASPRLELLDHFPDLLEPLRRRDSLPELAIELAVVLVQPDQPRAALAAFVGAGGHT